VKATFAGGRLHRSEPVRRVRRLVGVTSAVCDVHGSGPVIPRTTTLGQGPERAVGEASPQGVEFASDGIFTWSLPKCTRCVLPAAFEQLDAGPNRARTAAVEVIEHWPPPRRVRQATTTPSAHHHHHRRDGRPRSPTSGKSSPGPGQPGSTGRVNHGQAVVHGHPHASDVRSERRPSRALLHRLRAISVVIGGPEEDSQHRKLCQTPCGALHPEVLRDAARPDKYDRGAPPPQQRLCVQLGRWCAACLVGLRMQPKP
jgi:hypothetical protein